MWFMFDEIGLQAAGTCFRGSFRTCCPPGGNFFFSYGAIGSMDIGLFQTCCIETNSTLPQTWRTHSKGLFSDIEFFCFSMNQDFKYSVCLKKSTGPDNARLGSANVILKLKLQLCLSIALLIKWERMEVSTFVDPGNEEDNTF